MRNIIKLIIFSIILMVPKLAICENTYFRLFNLYSDGYLEQFIEGFDKDKNKLTEDDRVSLLPKVIETCYTLNKIERMKLYMHELTMLAPDADIPIKNKYILDTYRDIQLEKKTKTIYSASKYNESILITPAFTSKLTHSMIFNRGYTNLSEIFSDLSGIDITVQNGIVYSNLFFRGYRSNATDRTLFLYNGVEDNDLWSNIAWISRQYPLLSINAMEIIYGPSSTIYGNNAFLGVININTEEKEKNTVKYTTGVGSYKTSFIEAIAHYQKNNISISTEVKRFFSNEPDLGSYTDWDYTFTKGDYVSSLTISKNSTKGKNLVSTYGNNTYMYNTLRTLTDTLLVPTAYAINRASALDSVAYTRKGKKINYTDKSNDMFFNINASLLNVNLGYQTWIRNEGATPTYTEKRSSGQREGNVWIPINMHSYLKFNLNLNRSSSIFIFMKHKVHTLDGRTKIEFIKPYASKSGPGLSGLFLWEQPKWVPDYYYYFTTQNSTEIVYNKVNKEKDYNLIVGGEYKNSVIQGDYLTSKNPYPNNLPDTEKNVKYYPIKDLSAYFQFSTKLPSNMRLVAGARISKNTINKKDGYGIEFNPKVSLNYLKSNSSIRAVYSTAFRDATSFQKYTTSEIRPRNNPDLDPEKVKSYDIIYTYYNKKVEINSTVYYSRYSNITEDIKDEFGYQRFESSGKLAIKGFQFDIDITKRSYNACFNYTFTDPKNIDADKRIGDIASHKSNFIFTYNIKKTIGLTLRVNYVGDRKTGKDTTIRDNPYDVIPSYIVFHIAVFKYELFKNCDFRIIINNVFNKEYFHPGVRSADGELYSAKIPQEKRKITVTLTKSFKIE